jgi:hypothetical protein
VTSSEEFGSELQQGLGATLHDLFLRTMLPGVFGGPWTADGAGSTIYTYTSPELQALFVALTAAVVSTSIWLRGRAAWAGWMLIAAYLAADFALLVLGRGSYLLLVARDPRYVTDALPVVVIGVCAAFCTPLATGQARRARRRRDRIRGRRRPAGAWLGPLAALALTGLLIGSGVLTTVRLAPAVQHQRSEEYVDTLTSELADSPGASVLDTPVPDDISVAVSLPSLLHAIWREQALNRPGDQPTFVDPDGHLVPADLISVDLDRQGPAAGCGWPVDERPVVLGFMGDPAEGDRLLRVNFVAGSPGVLHVAVGDVEQAVEHRPGLGVAYFVVTGQTGLLRAWISGSGEGVCVTDLQRGFPGLVE